MDTVLLCLKKGKREERNLKWLSLLEGVNEAELP
jgi:hypothetical protein